MSRSVRDLRELICISRLSYHEEDEESAKLGYPTFAGEDNSKSNHVHVPKETKTNAKVQVSSKKKAQDRALKSVKGIDMCVNPPLSPGSSGKGSPLPPIRKSPGGSASGTGSSSSPGSSGRSSPQSPLTSSGQGLLPLRPISSIARKYQPQKTNFDEMLVFMDASVVGEWLTRANDSVKTLTSWLHADYNFVHFVHFWLSEMSNSKRREIVDIEFSIIMDELQFAFGVGLQSKAISHQDVTVFISAVFWEYPGKLSESDSHFFLNMFVCLCSGRKDNYKALLSNVKCSTTNKQFVQLILATRSFAIVNMCSGIIEFYKQIISSTKQSTILSETSLHSRDMVSIAKDFAFQAVEKGLVDVFEFLVLNYQLEPALATNSSGKNVLFSAVCNGQEDMVTYLLSLNPRLDVNKAALSSGNTPLHAAVNSGNCNIVRLLVKSGARVNTWNAECEGATPLHLAIMSGNEDMVSLLLSLGCDCTAKMGVPAVVTPLDLAKDLGLDEIAEMLSQTTAME